MEINNTHIDKAIFAEAVDAWGKASQLLQATEELAELIKAIMKHINRGGCFEDIIEESVDVSLMLEQIRYMFPSELWEIIYQMKVSKLERLLCEHYQKGASVEQES